MDYNFSPEILDQRPIANESGEEHRHAAVGFIVIEAILTIFFLLVFTKGVGMADENNPLIIDREYLVGRAYELANFQKNEKPVEPAVKYIMPGEVYLGESVQIGDSVRKVLVVNPKNGFGGIEATFVAPKYLVNDAGKASSVQSFKRVVGDILADGGYQLAKEDIVNPPATTAMTANLIDITRVTVAEIEEFETLPYQTKEIEDPNIDRGVRKVTQEGKTGKKTFTYRVRRENGVEVSRDLVKTEVISKPEDKIIKIGTRVVVLSSVKGYATATNRSDAVVSANYKRGTLLRITNTANGVSIFKTVNYTWGIASAPEGVVLDLSWSILDELKYNGGGKGPMVLVEEIKQ